MSDSMTDSSEPTNITLPWLELGGGANPCHHPNLDATHGLGVWKRDVRDGIPLRDGSVEHIHSKDFFEHLTFYEGLELLKECHRVLVFGGDFEFCIPEMELAVQRNPEWNDHMRNILYGTRRDTYDTHRMWYSKHLMAYILMREGWADVEVLDTTEGGEPRQPKFLVRARKGTSVYGAAFEEKYVDA